MLVLTQRVMKPQQALNNPETPQVQSRRSNRNPLTFCYYSMHEIAPASKHYSIVNRVHNTLLSSKAWAAWYLLISVPSSVFLQSSRGAKELIFDRTKH